MPAIFDGTDDRIDYAYATDGPFSFGTAGAAKTTLQEGAIAGWVRNQSVTNAYRVLFADNTAGATHHFAITYQIAAGVPSIRILIRGSTSSYTAYCTPGRARGNKERIFITWTAPASTSNGVSPTFAVYVNGVAITVNLEAHLNGTLIGGGGGWSFGATASDTSPVNGKWTGEMEGMRVWNSAKSASDAADDYSGNPPSGSVYFPFASDSTGYKTDGETPFSGTETGSPVFRSTLVDGEGLSAEWKESGLAGDVGSDATSWTETLTQAALDTGTGDGKCEIDDYLARHIAPDHRTFKVVKLGTSGTTNAGNAVWGNSSTIYIAVAPRAYIQNYGDSTTKVIMTFSSGHIRIEMTTAGLLQVYSAAGATATVTSALRIPCSPCVIAIRLSKTSPTTGTPAGIKFWINEDRSEDVPGSELTVGTSSQAVPSTFVNMVANQSDSTNSRFSGDIWHVLVSAKPDSDSDVLERIRAIGETVGIRTTAPSKIFTTSHDSHLNGQVQTLNRNCFKQLWPEYPEAEFYNFSIPGSTAAEAYGQVLAYVDEADVLARAPAGSRTHIILAGANDLGDTNEDNNPLNDDPPTDNSTAVNTAVNLMTAHLVSRGFKNIEIEPLPRSDWTSTTNDVIREGIRQTFWTKRQADTNVARRVTLPSALRSWDNGTTPSAAAIAAITGNTTYFHTDALHLNKAGWTAILNGDSGTGSDGLLGAVEAALRSGGTFRSRNYRRMGVR